MKYKPYPKYKDSGVEWLGEIPEHWQILPLRRLIKRIRNGVTLKQIEPSDYTVQVTRIETISQGVVDLSKTGHVEWVPLLLNYELQKGDLLFSHINSISMIGNCALYDLDVPLYHGMNLLCLRPNSIVSPRWFWYLISSEGVRWSFGSLAKPAINQASLTTMEIKSFRLVLPPPNEQYTIIKHIDNETARIDTLIKKKERQIALLKEKRAALISHAVTKGLDPNVKMKDSGVEWLGEIPEHWSEIRFRFLFSFSRGLPITRENLLDDGVPCVNYGEIHSKYGFEINPEKHDLKCVAHDYLTTSKKSLLNRGDFVFADTSEDIEGSGNFTCLDSDVQTFAGYHTIIAMQKNDYSYRYLAYLFDSLEFRSQIRSEVAGVKVFSITQLILKDSSVLLPSPIEQSSIAFFLDRETLRIDSMIEKVQQSINLLKEYRTALISAAVTGKIDVREAV